jgi:hypothetical protein
LLKHRLLIKFKYSRKPHHFCEVKRADRVPVTLVIGPSERAPFRACVSLEEALKPLSQVSDQSNSGCNGTRVRGHHGRWRRRMLAAMQQIVEGLNKVQYHDNGPFSPTRRAIRNLTLCSPQRKQEPKSWQLRAAMSKARG